MASITIRKLPTRTKERLRVQAAHSGVSLEAHARQLLQRAADADASSQRTDLGALAKQCFGATNGVEIELPPRGAARDPISFE